MSVKGGSEISWAGCLPAGASWTRSQGPQKAHEDLLLDQPSGFLLHLLSVEDVRMLCVCVCSSLLSVLSDIVSMAVFPF